MQRRSYILTDAGREVLGANSAGVESNSSDIGGLSLEKLLPAGFSQRLGVMATFAAFPFDTYTRQSPEVAEFAYGSQPAWIYRLHQSNYAFKIAPSRRDQAFLEGAVQRGAKLAAELNPLNLITPGGWLIRVPQVYGGLFVKKDDYMEGGHVIRGSHYSVEIMDWIHGGVQVGGRDRSPWQLDRGIRGEVGTTVARAMPDGYVYENLQDFVGSNLMVVKAAVPKFGASGTVWIIDQYFPVPG